MAKRKLSISDLELLLEALEEISAHFYMVGFHEGGSDPTQEAEGPASEPDRAEENASEAAADESADDESYDDLLSGTYDREDIEIALDAFLSDLRKAKLIKADKKGHLPSFSQVFEQLFNDNSLVKKAKEFERFIEGYFGLIAYEDMQSAHGTFIEVQQAISSELKDVKKT